MEVGIRASSDAASFIFPNTLLSIFNVEVERKLAPSLGHLSLRVIRNTTITLLGPDYL